MECEGCKLAEKAMNIMAEEIRRLKKQLALQKARADFNSKYIPCQGDLNVE